VSKHNGWQHRSEREEMLKLHRSITQAKNGRVASGRMRWGNLVIQAKKIRGDDQKLYDLATACVAVNWTEEEGVTYHRNCAGMRCLSLC
jgi:hypothetical protein